jgi:alkylation response protein AidB-like acyl-CoA dehydrogenase
MMRLQLNEEQVQFQDSLAKFLAEALPVTTLRRYGERDEHFDAALWRGACDLGLAGLFVPEAFGGSGLGVLDAALASEALGAAAAPINFAGACVMAVKALLAIGSEAQRQQWLPQIASGDARVAVVFAGALSGQPGEAELQLEGGRLVGQLEGAIDMGGATHVLALLADGRGAWVDVSAAGVQVRFRTSLDRTRAIADLRFDAVAAEVLETGEDRVAAARRVVDLGRVMLAADTLGAAQTMMDRAVAYAKERTQFDRIIGSFQGVKYMCADMVTALAPCRAFVWSAALAQEGEGEAEAAQLAACHLKAHVGDVGRDVSRMATEVHGGIGFTDELGLHYWLRRISFNRQMLGGPEVCRRQAAHLQGWMAA